MAPKTTPNADKSRFIKNILRLEFQHRNRYILVIPVTFKNRGKVLYCTDSCNWKLNISLLGGNSLSLIREEMLLGGLKNVCFWFLLFSYYLIFESLLCSYKKVVNRNDIVHCSPSFWCVLIYENLKELMKLVKQLSFIYYFAGIIIFTWCPTQCL